MYFHIFMLSSVGILYYNFTIIQYRFTKYNIVLFIEFVLLFIHLVVHIGISNHVYISTHYCPNNMYCMYCLLLSVCLLFEHDIPNASLYLCLFLYIYMHLFMCLNVDTVTNMLLQFKISVNTMKYYLTILGCYLLIYLFVYLCNSTLSPYKYV